MRGTTPNYRLPVYAYVPTSDDVWVDSPTVIANAWGISKAEARRRLPGMETTDYRTEGSQIVPFERQLEVKELVDGQTIWRAKNGIHAILFEARA